MAEQKSQDNVRDQDNPESLEGEPTEVSSGSEGSMGTEHPAGGGGGGDTGAHESSPVWDMARTGDSFTHPAVAENVIREFVREVLKKR